MALKKMGVARFDREPASGPFGTMEKPAIIYSGHGERAVGCVGKTDSPL